MDELLPFPSTKATGSSLSPITKLILALSKACREVDHKQVESCLLSPDFLINDDEYVYSLPSKHWPGLAMNASAFILCSAVSGRSRGIVKLLLYETAPGSVLNPSAMESLPLQWAILFGDREIIELIGNRTQNSPIDYLPSEGKKYHLFEFTEQQLAEAPIDVLIAHCKPSAAEVLKLGLSFPASVPLTYFSLVRNTPLHMALLDGLRRTNREEFFIELALASSLRERQKSKEWRGSNPL